MKIFSNTVGLACPCPFSEHESYIRENFKDALSAYYDILFAGNTESHSGRLLHANQTLPCCKAANQNHKD